MSPRRQDPVPDEAFPARVPGVSSRLLHVNGMRVRLVEAGTPGASPVVLLHGWGASAYNFRGLFEPLAAAGCHAMAPELPGHGGTETRLPPGAWTRTAMGEWMRQLLDTLGVERCVLVGQSIGGAVALDAASLMPARVRALLLLAPIGFTPVRRVKLAHVARLWAPSATPQWTVRFVLRRIYGTRGQWSDGDLLEYWAPLRRADTVRAILQSAREFDFTPRHPASLRLHGVRTVIRFGELDRLIPHGPATRQAAGIPGADIAVLTGVGHVPAEEIPDEIATLIITMSRYA